MMKRKNKRAEFIENLRKRFPTWITFNINDFLINCPYSLDELRIKDRKQDVMHWRQIGMVWRALEVGSLTKGAAYFNHDHATCIHAIRCFHDAFDGYHDSLMDKIEELTEGASVNVRTEDDLMKEVVNLVLLERRINELI